MFDLKALQEAIRLYGRVARVVIAQIEGSAPREVGASMLIWREADGSVGQSGTIGGGALEYAAALAAAAALGAEHHAPHVESLALGPALGQCCGGRVKLLREIFSADDLPRLAGSPLIIRPITANADPQSPPLALTRLIHRHRSQGILPKSQWLQGWMIEAVQSPQREIWIWGAGHVGRAITNVLAPFPELALTWIDVAAERFPETTPEGVKILAATDPCQVVRHAPPHAEHLVVTYSHALDLELCHQILIHGAAALGVIGSATKAARFTARLRALGHSAASVARIQCPIGDVTLGKTPQAIAVGIAVQLMKPKHESEPEIADDSRDNVRR